MPQTDADPRLLALYPLLYVAWADGSLTDREVGLIRDRFVSAGVPLAVLEPWLDADNPPDSGRLLDLLGAIRRGADGLAPAARSSLAALGASLAEAEGHAPDSRTRTALEELEEILGLDHQETSAALFADSRPLAELRETRPGFDVAAMARWLDGDETAVRMRVRELLSDPRFELAHALPTDLYRERVLQWCRVLADEGLGGLANPASAGGADDPAAFVAVFETLACFDLSLAVKFGVQFGLFGGSVLQLGTEAHHEAYLHDIARLELPGCFAMTETGHGSNVHDIETVATYDPSSNEFEIHTPNRRAWKDYIGNAAVHGRLATVFAQLETGGDRHGVHAFLVPIRGPDGTAAPGVMIEDCGEKLGLNGVDNGRLAFERVRIPRENLLDRFGSVNEDGRYESPIASSGKRFFTMLGTLVGGRVAVGSAAVTAAKVALATAIRYGARRRQFGPPGEPERLLLDYPHHQRRLFPRLAKTYALNFALHDLQRRYADPAEERRRLEAAAAGLKAAATWHATDVIQECREACGGQGYMSVNRLDALKADSDVFTTFEGDNTVLMQLVAKDLLTGFRQGFGESGALGLARFMVERARVAVTERNPIIARRSAEDHLRDPEYHLAIFDARRSDLLYSLARRVRHRVERGVGGFDALVQCQSHALVAARAHVDHEVLAVLVDAERSAPGSSLAESLERLRSLHALSVIEANAAWFLEHGYLDPPKTKAVRDLVTRLCGELRRDAVGLVDAFDIPAGCLPPIATA